MLFPTCITAKDFLKLQLPYPMLVRSYAKDFILLSCVIF